MMDRTEFDEEYDEEPSKPSMNRRRGKQSIKDEQDDDYPLYRKKRSSKRFHRKKTHKDQFWDQDDV